MDKRYFTDVLGFSCIENYVLGLLKYNGIESSYLFYESYITIDELINCFIGKGISYEYFNGIRRLHSIAIENKIITYKNVRSDDCYEVYKLICSGHYFVLLKAGKEFVFKNFYYKNWRDDYYLLVYFEKGKMYCLNGSSKTQIVINDKDFKDLYKGEFILLQISGSITLANKQKYFDKFKELFQREKHTLCMTDNLCNYNLNTIRDLLLTYKITRKRTIDFLNLYYPLEMNFEMLDKQIFRIEYTQAKNNYENGYNRNMYDDILKFLYNFERDFTLNIDKSLEEICI